MNKKVAIVVTTIHGPNKVLRAIADGAEKRNYQFFIVGDKKSPQNFLLDGCTYLDLAAQLKSNIAFAAACPTSHYARKNVGYLAAIINGAEIILETDDDNIPRESFFDLGDKQLFAHTFEKGDWVNVYRFFTKD